MDLMFLGIPLILVILALLSQTAICFLVVFLFHQFYLIEK